MHVIPRILHEVEHFSGELARILLSFEDSRTYLYLFDVVHIQIWYNRLVGKAVEVEKVGYSVRARLLYLLLVARVPRRFCISVDNLGRKPS